MGREGGRVRGGEGGREREGEREGRGNNFILRLKVVQHICPEHHMYTNTSLNTTTI